MSNYSRTAMDAEELLKMGESVSLGEYDPSLAAEFLMSAAALASSNDSRTVELAQVLEFLDVRQHVSLSAHEVAMFVVDLKSRGILSNHRGPQIVFAESGWKTLPRTKSGSLALSKRDTRQWLSLVAKR